MRGRGLTVGMTNRHKVISGEGKGLGRGEMHRRVEEHRPERKGDIGTLLRVVLFVTVAVAVFIVLWMLRPYVSTEPLVSFW